IAPAGEEAVKIAKDFLGPEVNAALARIALREFDDGNALRPEKKDQRNNPEPDGDATVRGDGGDHVQVENSDDEKENEVPAAQNATQTRSFILHRRSGRDDFVGQPWS